MNVDHALNAVMFHAGQRSAVLKTTVAMQNRLKSHLEGVHFAKKLVFQAGNEMFQCDPLPPDYLDGSWREVDVKAWLKKPSKYFPKELWNPGYALLSSPVAMVLLENIENLQKDLAFRGKQLESAAEDLHVADWVHSIRGAGMGNLGKIIGETGDLANYDNPSKVWTRMGVGLIQVVINETQSRKDGSPKPLRPFREGDELKKGESVMNIVQQKVAGNPDLAIAMQYKPERRSIVWNLEKCLIKLNKEADGSPGYFKRLYDWRKQFEVSKNPDIRPIAADFRASRYMGKRFLALLWCEWNQVSEDEYLEISHGRGSGLSAV